MLEFKNKIKQLKDRNYLIDNPTEILLIKKAFNNVLTWNDFVSLIDFTSTDNYYSSNVRREAIAEYADEFYIRVADIIDPNTKKSVGNLFPNLDEVVTFCNELFEEEIDYFEEDKINKTISEDNICTIEENCLIKDLSEN